MTSLTAKTTALGAFALALVNLLTAFGLHLAPWASGAAVSLVNAALLAIVGAVAGIKHLMEANNASS